MLKFWKCIILVFNLFLFKKIVYLLVLKIVLKTMKVLLLIKSDNNYMIMGLKLKQITPKQFYENFLNLNF